MEKIVEELRAGRELTEAEVAESCGYLMNETISVEDRAELLEVLAAKEETANEIAAFVRTLIGHAVGIEVGGGRPVMDLCGTGGDRLGLFNVSTAAMFVVAACGVTVVKHGNRGITSKCGGRTCWRRSG